MLRVPMPGLSALLASTSLLLAPSVQLSTVSPSPPAAASPTREVPGPKPPRVDGPYVGVVAAAATTFARVRSIATPQPLTGIGGSFRFGEVVLPWLALGLELTGSLGWGRPEGALQRVGEGALLADVSFFPVPRHPFGIRVGAGIGGGAVREEGRAGRSGYGGAVFAGALRYEFFPAAHRRRKNRGGGFAIAPQIGWTGFLPAAAGRPMAHAVHAGVGLTFYFGS